MRNLLFVMTHYGTAYLHISSILNQSPHIGCFSPDGESCHHYADLSRISSFIHKRDNAKAIWTVPIYENHNFTCKNICKHEKCRFIYLAGVPEDTLEYLSNKRYDLARAVDYYCFRLQGMLQYYKRSGGLWLRQDKLDIKLLSEYLDFDFQDKRFTHCVSINASFTNCCYQKIEKYEQMAFLLSNPSLRKKQIDLI